MQVPPQHRALVVALVASLLLWNLPFGGVVLYPFKLLATWLHEMSHGLVMLLSGAGFSRLEIYRDTSGIAYAEAGVGPVGRAAIAAAGYMGASAWGALMLVLGQAHQRSRRVLASLAAVLAMSAIIWVDNDFGLWAVWIAAGSLLAIALVAGRILSTVVVNFIAAQACVHAVLDIRVLFRTDLVINGQVVGASDAHNMAAATFGSHQMWAFIWLFWSLACFYVALRFMRRSPLASPPLRHGTPPAHEKPVDLAAPPGADPPPGTAPSGSSESPAG